MRWRGADESGAAAAVCRRRRQRAATRRSATSRSAASTPGGLPPLLLPFRIFDRGQRGQACSCCRPRADAREPQRRQPDRPIAPWARDPAAVARAVDAGLGDGIGLPYSDCGGSQLTSCALDANCFFRTADPGAERRSVGVRDERIPAGPVQVRSHSSRRRRRLPAAPSSRVYLTFDADSPCPRYLGGIAHRRRARRLCTVHGGGLGKIPSQTVRHRQASSCPVLTVVDSRR